MAKKYVQKLAGNVMFFSLLLILAVLVFFLVQSRLVGGPPTMAGYRLFAVMSGSMEPAISTGSLIAVKPVDPSLLQEGDVISFGGVNGKIITHRINGIADDGLSFVTKGDANDAADSGTVPADRVIGVVALAIPWLGRILVFSQTKQGLLLMIIVPALVIMVLEARSLWLYAVQADREKAEKAESKAKQLST